MFGTSNEFGSIAFTGQCDPSIVREPYWFIALIMVCWSDLRVSADLISIHKSPQNC